LRIVKPKKVEAAVWRAMVIGSVAVVELLPPAVLCVVPALRVGRAGASENWPHPAREISVMAMHNMRSALNCSLGETRQGKITGGT
jgi:hypothetical protein